MMNQRLLHYVGMMIVSLSLLGCGVKGDLYYPKNSGTPTNSTSTKSAPANNAPQDAPKTEVPKTGVSASKNSNT